MCVHACAGLQFQHLSIVTQGPNPRECCIEMAHNGFTTLSQDGFQTLIFTESHAHVSADSYLAGVRCSHFSACFLSLISRIKPVNTLCPSLDSSPNEISTGNSWPFLRNAVSSVPCQLMCRWPVAK